MKTRVLLHSDIFPPKTGGSGRWFWEIYTRVPRENVVVVAGDDPQAASVDAATDLAIRRWALHFPTRGLRPFVNLLRYLSLARRLRKLVKSERIDVIHTGRNLPEGFIAWLSRKPYWCYVHGEDVAVSATSRELAWMTRRVLRRARGLIANSENTQRMLLEDWKVPSEKVHVLHPGVDTTRFVPAPRDDGFRGVRGWTDRTVILTVGRLQKRKGHDMLIRALPHLVERFPTVLYAIVGDGEEREPLESLVTELGMTNHVRFLGEIDDADLIRCYQQCDVFALPNRAVGRDEEGFGMVLLEAQACGRAVLAGASGGTAETMQAGETGVVVDCTEPGPLADGLASLLEDSEGRVEMGRRGRKWVCGSFDWAALSRKAAGLFDR